MVFVTEAFGAWLVEQLADAGRRSRRLWHPIDPTRPDAALRELPDIEPRTVVCLNEAQFYLDVTDSNLGERVAAGPGCGATRVGLWCWYWPLCDQTGN